MLRVIKRSDTSWYWFTDDRGVDSSITAYRICTGECCCIWLLARFSLFMAWISNGCITCLFIIRHFGRSRFFSFVNKHERVRKAMGWIERKGFAPIFVIFCFPFTPSALINVVAGLSRISVKQFGLALAFGKLVMIFILTYIGHDLMSFIHNPVKSVIVAIGIFILWYVGKKIEVKLELH